MSDLSREEIDEGTIAALLMRSRRRIPNLLAIKKRLEAGGTLSSLEITEMVVANEEKGGTKPDIDCSE